MHVTALTVDETPAPITERAVLTDRSAQVLALIRCQEAPDLVITLGPHVCSVGKKWTSLRALRGIAGS